MIYNYQKDTYNELRKAFLVHQVSLGLNTPVRPRNNRLVIGPSGSGKTHLAELVAKELNWARITLNTTAWIIKGAKGEQTWDDITRWVSSIPPSRPAVIILDEIDKISSDGSSWVRFLQAELYSLFDGRLPSVGMEVADSDYFATPSETAKYTENKLKEVLVLGCGAFQALYDLKASIGFGQHERSKPPLNRLREHLPIELINRFNQNVIAIPRLCDEDYISMQNDVINSLPEALRNDKKIEAIADAERATAIARCGAARFGEALMSRVFEYVAGDDQPQPWVEPKKEEKKQVETQEDIDREIDALWEEQLPPF